MPNSFTRAIQNSLSETGDSILLAAEGRRLVAHDIARAVGRLFGRIPQSR